MAVRGRFTRFSTGTPIHVYPGLSAQQAADNPELAKKIAAEQGAEGLQKWEAEVRPKGPWRRRPKA